MVWWAGHNIFVFPTDDILFLMATNLSRCSYTKYLYMASTDAVKRIEIKH